MSKSPLIPLFSFTGLRLVAELQQHLAEVDKHYDRCNDAWAQGEADRFTGDKLPGIEKMNSLLFHLYFLQKTRSLKQILLHPRFWKMAEDRMKDATFASGSQGKCNQLFIHPAFPLSKPVVLNLSIPVVPRCSRAAAAELKARTVPRM